MTAVLDPGGARSAGPRTPVRHPALAVAAAAAAVVVSGVTAAVAGPAVAVAAGASVVLLVVVALRPAIAVYVYLGTLPFLAGIDRGRLLPLVRPNEALFALLVAGAVLGAYLRFVRGDELRWRLSPLDLPLGTFVLFSTLWPLTWLLLRGTTPDGSDLAALLPICKLVALLVLVRATIRTEDELLRVARVVIRTAAGLAVIAVLQTLGFPPVLRLLESYWLQADRDPLELTERGSTTLASSIATGDYVIIALALLLALGVRGLVGRRETVLAGVPLAAGVLAAGQFSTWAAAGVVGAGLLTLHPELRRLAVRLLPVAGIGVLVGLPAFVSRLSEFGDGFGVPRSWLGRWDNLVSFYLPGLGDLRWVLGVSPDSVLPAPETWREEIFLEYGYLQFLWVGGLPLLIAFGWLSLRVFRAARECAARPGAAGAYGTTLWAVWWVVLVLSVIDIHLVLRGAGELIFLCLAVVSGRTHDRG